MCEPLELCAMFPSQEYVCRPQYCGGLSRKDFYSPARHREYIDLIGRHCLISASMDSVTIQTLLIVGLAGAIVTL